MVRAVVLGANGFLGAALVRCLHDNGHLVTAVSRHSAHQAHFTQSNSTEDRILRYSGDVNDLNLLERVFKQADIVYHAATSTHPTLNLDNPRAEIDLALKPLIGVMQQATLSGVGKIVFPSSGGTVYIDQAEPRTETTATNPRTPYAIFKLAAEQLLLTSASRGGSAVDVMRIANLYGPRQPVRPGHGVLPHWLKALREHQPLKLFGDGTASRDYVHVDDAAQCLASSCNRLEQTDVFNIGTGQATSLNKVLKLLQQACPYSFEIQKIPVRPTDLHSVSLDSSKLLATLPGFSWTPFAAGLRQLIAQPELKSY